MAYVSNLLTHWVGRGKTAEEQYRILTECVLKKKELLFNKCSWHFSSKYGGVGDWPIPMISFTDIPLSECAELCNRYSCFGLAFEKHYLANCLACPVGYVQHPFIHNNFSYIYHMLKGMKNILKGIEVPEGKKKGEIFDAERLLSRILYSFCFLEDHSTNEFRYNEGDDEPLPDQEHFFEDPASLYYEREWRMVLSGTGDDLPWYNKREGKVYFQFKEQYLRWVILPKELLQRLKREHNQVFHDYSLGAVPSLIAYEDLKHF